MSSTQAFAFALHEGERAAHALARAARARLPLEDRVERVLFLHGRHEVLEVAQAARAEAAARVHVLLRRGRGLARLAACREVEEVGLGGVLRRHEARHARILFRHSWIRFQTVFGE